MLIPATEVCHYGWTVIIMKSGSASLAQYEGGRSRELFTDG